MRYKETITKLSHTLGRELGITTLLLLGVSLVVFVILYAAPGDAFSMLIDQQQAEQARSALGFSQSWFGQYLDWLGSILRGDFGHSIRSGQPVMDELLNVIGNTLLLTIAAMAITLSIAIPIAVYTATSESAVATTPLVLGSYVISSLPVFWLGYIAIYVSTEIFDYFPLAVGRGSGEGLEFAQILLPIVVLGFGSGIVSEVVRQLHMEISRVMSEEYIRTARAKGAKAWMHAFKEAYLLPLTDIFAAKIPFLLSGAIIVEQVFNWPGMGRMAWQAAQDRDFPVIMGVTLAAALLVRAGSLIQHLIHATVSPPSGAEE